MMNMMQFDTYLLHELMSARVGSPQSDLILAGHRMPQKYEQRRRQKALITCVSPL